MAPSRQFVDISDDDLDEFSKEHENTTKKTEYYVRIFREYLDTIQERRDITEMQFPGLQKIYIKFILAFKKSMERSTPILTSPLANNCFKNMIKSSRYRQ